MLQELRISNFRLFDDEVTVRFRPITVLIGRNNAGKSSIIKFLLMLQQSLTAGNPQFLTPEGNKVNLGIFSELKNSLTRKRNLKFELKTQSNSSPTYPLYQYLKEKKFRHDDFSRLMYTLNATVSYNKKGQGGTTQYSLTDVSGEKFLRRSKRISDDTIPLDFAREFASEVSREVPKIFAEYECLVTLRYQVNSIRHLLPVREESQRVILASPPPTGDVGQRGQYALPHLQKMMDENKDRYEFMLPHLENVAGIEEIQFKKYLGYLSQCLAKSSTTGADVFIGNYGFGVSQCLPIFIQGVIMPPMTSLVVEQPEAQLHPTAQLEMGSFFADLWKERNVGSIIETHSDNILLRLRRLIANGTLPAKDVSVAYFTHDEEKENMPVIKNLDIEKDGSMEKGLPMEFFGADLAEGLKLGARE